MIQASSWIRFLVASLLPFLVAQGCLSQDALAVPGPCCFPDPCACELLEPIDCEALGGWLPYGVGGGGVAGDCITCNLDYDGVPIWEPTYPLRCCGLDGIQLGETLWPTANKSERARWIGECVWAGGNPVVAIEVCVCPCVPRGADVNGDNLINAFDIDPFVALVVSGVQQPDGRCPEFVAGDINVDGVLNNFDIDPFLDLLLL